VWKTEKKKHAADYDAWFKTPPAQCIMINAPGLRSSDQLTVYAYQSQLGADNEQQIALSGGFDTMFSSTPGYYNGTVCSRAPSMYADAWFVKIMPPSFSSNRKVGDALRIRIADGVHGVDAAAPPATTPTTSTTTYTLEEGGVQHHTAVFKLPSALDGVCFDTVTDSDTGTDCG
jgi:hypothetical protein